MADPHPDAAPGAAVAQGVTRTLARYVAGASLAALPASVRNEGRRAFVNWVGSVFGGCRTPAVVHALPLFDRYSGPREATAIGTGKRLDIFGASFINAMSNAGRSFNDTHLRTVAHPTVSVAAVQLALAETRPTRGTDFINALILGIEVQCRVGNILVTPPAKSHFALSMIALVAGIGAAAAAARQLALDEQQIRFAIGLAAAQAGGTRATHGTMGGRMLSGEAARAGLMSALLAQAGFTGPEEAFEGAKGFANAHATDADPKVAIAGLGTEFEILSLAYKPYPCGIVIHPVIDVCLDLVRAHDFAATDVERVVLAVPAAAMALTGRKDPTDSNTAGTSIYHWAAAALTHRAGGLAQGSTECVRDPAIIALRERVEAAADLSLAPDAARAEIHLKDGRVLRGSVEHARGSRDRPLTDADISDKFLGQAELLMPSTRAKDLLARCWGIVDAKDVRTQLSPLFEVAQSGAG